MVEQNRVDALIKSGGDNIVSITLAEEGKLYEKRALVVRLQRQTGEAIADLLAYEKMLVERN